MYIQTSQAELMAECTIGNIKVICDFFQHRQFVSDFRVRRLSYKAEFFWAHTEFDKKKQKCMFLCILLNLNIHFVVHGSKTYDVYIQSERKTNSTL